jgi:ATP-dependent helicase/nuclease subunit B
MIEKAYHKDYALENIGSFGEYLPAAKAALRLAGEEERLKISELDVKNNSLNLTKATAEKLYGGSLALTQSRIDSFVGCPLRYFCNYTLKLNPTGRAEFNAANIGTFIHEVLEKFFDTLKKKGTDIASITDEEKDSLIMAAAKGFAERYFEGIPKRSERLKTTIDRLCRSARPVVDGLCDEFANCKFAPKFFELAIDKNKPGNPEPAIFKASDGRDVYIYGVIDRVDTYENDGDVYVRVVDYKTGSKEFSPSDLERGENLQMFLYLKSIVDTDKPEFRKSLGLADGRKAIPSGVIYVKTDVGDGKITSPDGKGRENVLEKQKRLGMILDDPISIEAMNKNYLPIKVDKKSGELLTEGSKLVYSSEGWEAINEKIANAIKDIADRMISGEIAATKDCGKGAEACRYCDFKAFCRSSS